jgi:hypothetical protein
MGTIQCDGCTNRFCSIHFSDHEQHLHALFEGVNVTIERLCYLYHQIKSSRPLSPSNHPQLAGLLNELSNELRRRKDDDDYFEQDIERLNEKLEQIQTDFNTHLPHVRINVTPIDWPKVIQTVVEL